MVDPLQNTPAEDELSRESSPSSKPWTYAFAAALVGTLLLVSAFWL